MTGKLFGVPLVIIILILCIIIPIGGLMVSFQSANQSQLRSINDKLETLIVKPLPSETPTPTEVVKPSKFVSPEVVGEEMTPTAKPKKLPTTTDTLNQ